MSKAYLAYGSNMSVEQMKIRCPRARIIGTGMLQDWRLLFKGDHITTSFATIEEWQGYCVPFVLWDITRRHEVSLDLYEGYPRSYQKKYVDVEIDGQKYNALVYVKNESLPTNPPITHYYAVLYEAYEKFGFDLKILKEALEFSEQRQRFEPL